MDTHDQNESSRKKWVIRHFCLPTLTKYDGGKSMSSASSEHRLTIISGRIDQYIENLSSQPCTLPTIYK